MACDSCSFSFEEAIAKFKNNDEAAIEFFKDHGVIPRQKTCPTCNSVIQPNSEGFYRCQKQTTNRKTKRVTRCRYKSSITNGTWFEKSRISPSVNLLFVNVFLRKFFSQAYCEEEYGLIAKSIARFYPPQQ